MFSDLKGRVKLFILLSIEENNLSFITPAMSVLGPTAVVNIPRHSPGSYSSQYLSVIQTTTQLEVIVMPVVAHCPHFFVILCVDSWQAKPIKFVARHCLAFLGSRCATEHVEHA